MSFLLATLLLLATAALLAAQIAPRPLWAFLLATYTCAVAVGVGLALLLSLPGWLTPSGVWACLLVSCTGATALTAVRHPTWPNVSGALQAARIASRDPIVALLAVVVGAHLAYAAALGLLTAQNDDDTLGYHLARAGFWKQQHGVGYVPGATDVRLSSFPPFGEIQSLLTILTAGSDRFVAVPSLAALAAAGVAVYGIARTIGLDVREALYGAALFVTLPAVGLHAQTAFVDLPVAALLAVTVAFALRRTPHDLLLASLAAALALGTKVTAAIVFPALALVCWVAWRGLSRRPLLAAGAGALAVGGAWYAANIVRTGHPVGGFGGGLLVAHDPALALGAVIRLVLAAVGLPGAVGRDRLVFVLAAGVVLTVGLVAARRTGARAGAAAAALLVVLPLALLPLNAVLLRVFQKTWFELGRADIGNLDSGRSMTRAGAMFTWYGPVGLLLTLVAAVLVLRAVRTGALDRIASTLVAAPLLWIASIGLTVGYIEWNGRFMMAGFALAAATWGVTLDRRPLAWAVVTVATVTTLLTWVHFDEKPSGVRLLERSARPAVWGRPRWEVQADGKPVVDVFAFAATELPRHATVAVWPFGAPSPDGRPTPGLVPYPFFGRTVDRKVVLARTAAAARAGGAEWYVVPAGAESVLAPPWRVVRRTASGWVIASTSASR